MLNYELKEQYIRVKWKKKELGRIYHEADGWVYRCKGCEGKIESDRYEKLDDLKAHLEFGITYSV